MIISILCFISWLHLNDDGCKSKGKNNCLKIRMIVSKIYSDFNCEVVYFSGDRSCSYEELANVMPQQDLDHVPVGKVDFSLF